jgi:hypothetical protein
MNQADILKLATAAGFQEVTFNVSGFTGIFSCVAGQNLEPELTRFAELVAQHNNAERKNQDELILEALNAAQDEYSDAAKAYLIKTATKILEARTK